MVPINEEHFSNKQHLIIQSLDSVHRSLLLKNLEYENSDNTLQSISKNKPSHHLESEIIKNDLKLRGNKKQYMNPNTFKITNKINKAHYEKCECLNDCDSDSDGLRIDASKTYNTKSMCETGHSNISEHTLANVSEQVQQNKKINSKTIKIAIKAYKQTINNSDDEKESYSSESESSSLKPKNSNTGNDTVLSDCPSTSVDICCSSDSSNESHVYYDCNDIDQNSNSSIYEDTMDTLNCTSDIPLIRIIQEISESRTVTSTVSINKVKARKFSQSTRIYRTIEQPKPTIRQRSRQKIINDNVQNEILDQNIYTFDDISKEAEQDNSNIFEDSDTSLRTGKLEASPRRSDKLAGKLLAKRLERERTSAEKPSKSIEKCLSDKFDCNKDIKIPPLKPPRIFANSSSKNSSDGGNSSTTVAIGELFSDTKIEKKPYAARNLGWQFSIGNKDFVKPTCPTLDEISNVNWIYPTKSSNEPRIKLIEPKQMSQQQIYNMINYEQQPNKLMLRSENLMPQPQSRITVKEDIDTVDTPIKRSKNYDRFATDTIYSTPLKHDTIFENRMAQPAPLKEFVKPEVPPNIHSKKLIKGCQESDNFCKSCHVQMKKGLKSRKSFRKAAIKRTKTFFETSKKIASKKIIGRSQSIKHTRTKTATISDSDDYASPGKSDVTAQFNKESTDMSGKKSVKTLGFTPGKCESINISESPKRISEKFVSAIKQTPPKKPIRQSLIRVESNPEPFTPPFDFKRIVNSPKSDRLSNGHSKRSGFRLSPKKLFKNLNKSSTMTSDDKSYKSFAENGDDFIIYMGEYLKQLCNKMEAIDNSDSDPKPLHLLRSRKMSTSSNVLDILPQRLVEIDFHAEPEPIYSEIKHNNSFSINNNNNNNSYTCTPNKYIIANNDPKAIYATINKDNKNVNKSNLNAFSTNQTDITNLLTNNANVSYESLPRLNVGNDLVNSIENFLDKMKEPQNNYTSITSINSTSNSTSNNDFHQHIFHPIGNTVETSLEEKREHNVLQKTTPTIDDISTDTYLTDSICEEVLHGDAINANIANAINRLENLDPSLEYSQFRTALPESDDSNLSSVCDSKMEFRHTRSDFCDDIAVNTNNIQRLSISFEDSEEDKSLVQGHKYDRYNEDIDVVDHKYTSCSIKTQDHLYTQENINQHSPCSKTSSPTFRNFKNKLRNSFSKSSNFFKNDKFRMNMPSHKSNIQEPNIEDLSIKDYTPNKASNLTTAPSMIEMPDLHMLKLTNQITFQREIRKQLKNAIDVCRNIREFESSTELVEAERLMLLSDKKEICAKNELIRIDYDSDGLTTNPKLCCGTIAINDIEISLEREAMYDTYFNYHYVCVCSYRDQVVATFGRERIGDKVMFKNIKNMLFTDLDPDFKIQIEVYVLRLHKHIQHSPDSKQHTSNKEEKRSSLLSPVKLFASSVSPNKVRINSETSRFRLQGNTFITSSNCVSNKVEYIEHRPNADINDTISSCCYVYCSSVSKSFTLNLLDQSTNLSCPILIGFNSEIRLDSIELKGFLNIADGKLQHWNHRWVVINGCSMRFWNDPEEQYRLPPLALIDLTKCISDNIQLVDKKRCAMPKTFALDIFNNQSSEDGASKERIITYFISASSNSELIMWITELNNILKFIKNWNI